MLSEWGEIVKIDSSERCVSNIKSLGDVAQGIIWIQVKLFSLINQVMDVKK